MSEFHAEGLYNPTLRFAFTNITDDTLESKWDSAPITVPAGATVDLPHHLAEKLTKELVDKIMMGLTSIGGSKTKNEGMSLGVPQARVIWEEKIVRPLEVDEESPQMQIMRAQIKSELEADLKDAQKVTPSVSEISINPEEFADLKTEPEKTVKKPIKVKTIK